MGRGKEPARQTAICKTRVFRPVILKFPAEDLAVKGLRLGEIGRRELHVVNLSLTRLAPPPLADSISRRHIQLPSQCADSPCSGRGSLPSPWGFPRGSGEDCAQGVGARPVSCPVCRSRTANRAPPKSLAGADGACPRARGPRLWSVRRRRPGQQTWCKT